jgi:LPS export ABC transporter permease LptG/LPS export ABC transporter permease LptF
MAACASLHFVKKIDKLIILGIVPPFLIALSVLTFVVFAQYFGRLSELLITRNASIDVTLLLAGTMLPGVMIFSLPLSYLIGLLIGFSGLSGENQIVALRACGVPMRNMLRPILALGAIVAIITGIMSLVVLPQTTYMFNNIKDRISVRAATSQAQPRVFNEDFPGIVFYLDDLSVDKQRWSKVFLVDSSDARSPRTMLAREGTWFSDAADSRLQLQLKDGTVYEVNPDDPSKDNVSVFAKTDIPIEFNRAALTSAGGENSGHIRKPVEQDTRELWQGNPSAAPEDQLEQKIELHRRLAIPFTVLPFSLLGLALGISTKKGGRTYGFVLSLGLVLLFYTLFFNGIRIARLGTVPPWLGLWEANIILTLLGAIFIVLVERDRGFLNWLDFGQSKLGSALVLKFSAFEGSHKSIWKIDKAVVNSTLKLTRIRFPKILDVYISRGFLGYFLWSLLVCGTLFVLLTLFDLLDDIISHKIAISTVVKYFVFLTPHILMLMVPMSLLLAILINFGILEKSSEVTALKAGGWSLYRISFPIFLIAGLFCGGMYVLQDYILPYANIQQDGLRNIIKGRPAQTSMLPQRKWIFGESNRIFNYDYFDAGQNLFVELNVFEVDFNRLKVLKRIHAARATIQPSVGWVLENGWIRDFQSEQSSFRNITKESFAFPEKSSYFQKEIFQPKESAKLNYIQLKSYINYLNKSGYNATELHVELYKKIAFPLSCLVMALLGVPFSFSTGQKGAFFGITASVAIAMSYWGIYSVFEQMGAYGLLLPLLAAWAPNILFGAAGLALLFTIRT